MFEIKLYGKCCDHNLQAIIPYKIWYVCWSGDCSCFSPLYLNFFFYLYLYFSSFSNAYIYFFLLLSMITRYNSSNRTKMK